MDYKKLIEERAVVANEMNTLTALVSRENRSFSGEELEKFDKMDSDFKAITEKIETAKRVERMSELAPSKDNGGNVVSTYKPGKVQITRNDQDLAFKCWALKAGGKDSYIRREHIEAAHKVGMNLNSDSLTVYLADRPNEIKRNQSSAINSEGGYLQNDGVFQSLERNLRWFGGARQIAKVLRTENGEPISYAYSDDTSNLGVRLGQNNTVANQNLVYSKKTLGEYTYTSGVYPVAVQLLQDARIDVSSDIGEVLGQRLARVTNSDYTNGTGAAMPTGFMQDASAGVTAGGAAIAYNDLVNLLFSIDRAYRDNPSFAFVMSDSTLSALWKLADANGRPLFWAFTESMDDDVSGLNLLGKKIVVNNDMPSIATGKSPIVAIVGDKFIIRDVKEATIVALRERYMDQLAVGFMAYLRSDSKLLNGNCAKKLTMP